MEDFALQRSRSAGLTARSSATRGGLMSSTWYERMLISVGDQLSRVAVWHRWPFPFAMVILLANRTKLRWNNLFDTQRAPVQPPAPTHDIRAERSADGSYNDLASPWM